MTLLLGTGLLVILLVTIITGINAGIVAMLLAGILGTSVAGMSARDIADGFPGDMFIMLFGILLLLSVATQNGSVQWLVRRLVTLLGGRVSLLPWLLFGAALMSSSMGPGAAPLLFVVGAGFSRQFNISPLMIGAMIVHGNQAGFFSPIAPYGILFKSLTDRADIVIQPVSLYVTVVVFHVLLAIVIFFIFGGRNSGGQVAEPESAPAENQEEEKISGIQLITLFGFAALLLGSLLTNFNLGFLALGIAVVLLLCSGREASDKAIESVAWPILLIVCGVTLYVNVLQESGAIDAIAQQVTGFASANTVALIIGWLAGALTAIASTFGTLSMLLPLSSPLLLAGELEVTALLSLVAISAAVTDISPLSPLGAMFLASCTGMNRDRIFRQMLLYTTVMIVAVPVIVWLALIVF
jgi:di/tricarboxylate transporter